MDILSTLGLKSSPKAGKAEDENVVLQKTSDKLIIESGKLLKKAEIIEEIAESKTKIAEAKARIKAAGGSSGSGVLGKITPKQWVIIAIGVVVIIFLMRSCN